LNDALLRRAGVGTVIGGEFEQGLRDLARRLSVTREVSVRIASRSP